MPELPEENIPEDWVWFDFNDGTVKSATYKDVQKTYGISNETAYMLIYRRTNIKAEKKPEVSIPLQQDIF